MELLQCAGAGTGALLSIPLSNPQGGAGPSFQGLELQDLLKHTEESVAPPRGGHISPETRNTHGDQNWHGVMAIASLLASQMPVPGHAIGPRSAPALPLRSV